MHLLHVTHGSSGRAHGSWPAAAWLFATGQPMPSHKLIGTNLSACGIRARKTYGWWAAGSRRPAWSSPLVFSHSCAFFRHQHAFSTTVYEASGQALNAEKQTGCGLCPGGTHTHLSGEGENNLANTTQSGDSRVKTHGMVSKWRGTETLSESVVVRNMIFGAIKSSTMQ